MEEKRCPSCERTLPVAGLFCPNCLTQVRCSNCTELLLGNAKGCIYCGTSIGPRAENPAGRSPTPFFQNRIVIQETRSKRKVEAEFSDDVAKHVAGLWSQGSPMFDGKTTLSTALPKVLGQGEPEVLENANVAGLDPDGEVIDVVVKESGEDHNSLFSFFDDSNGRIRLIDTSLKANTVKESRIRATLLTLLFSELRYGKPSLPKETLIGIMKEANWFDLNYYTDLKDRTFLIEAETDRYQLTRKGKVRAQEILDEVLNPDIPERAVPQVGKGRKGKPKEDPAESTVTSSGKKASSANGKPDVSSLVRKWDVSPASNAFKALPMANQKRLDLVVLGLYAINTIHEKSAPVSRGALSSFIKEAFGISYSGKAIADLAAKEEGKLKIAYERGKGYTLRNAGMERVDELLQPSKD